MKNKYNLALGMSSKARNDKQKFDARYATLHQKSFSRRKKLTKLSMYQQFCAILSIRSSRTLNPTNFLDYLASLITDCWFVLGLSGRVTSSPLLL